MTVVTYIVGIIFLVSSFLLPTKWERMMAVCLTLVIVPSHSGYYCLLYLIPPIIAFLNETNHKYSDLLFLLSMLLIMHQLRGYLRDTLCNYQVAILIMTITLLVHSVLAIVRQLAPQKLNKEKFS